MPNLFWKDLLYLISFNLQPSSKLQNNDICIISVNGIYCTLNGNTIEPETKRIKTTYEIGLEEF